MITARCDEGPLREEILRLRSALAAAEGQARKAGRERDELDAEIGRAADKVQEIASAARAVAIAAAQRIELAETERDAFHDKLTIALEALRSIQRHMRIVAPGAPSTVSRIADTAIARLDVDPVESGVVAKA